MSKIINSVGTDQFKTEVMDSTLPVLVDFWAPWCGPCQMMAPVLEALSLKFDGKLKIVKVDTEEADNQRLAMDYQIQSIPNMKVFKDGKVIKDFVGYRGEEQLAQELLSVIA